MSTTTATLNPSDNSTQSRVASLTPRGLPTVTLVQVANNDTKSHPSVRNSVKITNLTHSMQSCMPQVVPSRLVSEPSAPSNN